MKSTRITFNYKFKEKILTLGAINEGFVYCKKLGFNPHTVILGSEEYHLLSYFHPPLGPEGLGTYYKGLKTKRAKADSLLAFNCHPSVPIYA